MADPVKRARKRDGARVIVDRFYRLIVGIILHVLGR